MLNKIGATSGDVLVSVGSASSANSEAAPVALYVVTPCFVNSAVTAARNVASSPSKALRVFSAAVWNATLIFFFACSNTSVSLAPSSTRKVTKTTNFARTVFDVVDRIRLLVCVVAYNSVQFVSRTH